jgi:hypothetical protein
MSYLIEGKLKPEFQVVQRQEGVFLPAEIHRTISARIPLTPTIQHLDRQPAIAATK